MQIGAPASRHMAGGGFIAAALLSLVFTVGSVFVIEPALVSAAPSCGASRQSYSSGGSYCTGMESGQQHRAKVWCDDPGGVVNRYGPYKGNSVWSYKGCSYFMIQVQTQLSY
jgi:hypothetical protein